MNEDNAPDEVASVAVLKKKNERMTTVDGRWRWFIKKFSFLFVWCPAKLAGRLLGLYILTRADVQTQIHCFHFVRSCQLCLTSLLREEKSSSATKVAQTTLHLLYWRVPSTLSSPSLPTYESAVSGQVSCLQIRSVALLYHNRLPSLSRRLYHVSYFSLMLAHLLICLFLTCSLFVLLCSMDKRTNSSAAP